MEENGLNTTGAPMPCRSWHSWCHARGELGENSKVGIVTACSLMSPRETRSIIMIIDITKCQIDRSK